MAVEFDVVDDLYLGRMEDNENKLPCAEKITYDSKSKAEGAAAAVDWQRGLPLKAYKCRYCHLWHLATA